jgi:uncharacterized repeat protein (TIGR01451 family)
MLKNKKTARRFTVIWLLALPFLTGSALAQGAGEKQPLVITAQILPAAREGDEQAARGDREAMLPGDVVVYRLTFTNTTDVPVRNVEFKDPVPAGLRYVAGSAAADREDVTIAYSIDGGRTYSAQPMIELVVDGERVMRPAPPEMYTHIRWLVAGWVQPGAQVTAEFRAQLPAAEANEEPGESR